VESKRGDFRIGHFLGIHAQQAIPILGALIGSSQLKLSTRWAVLIGGSIT
jgi:hypothetical protein